MSTPAPILLGRELFQIRNIWEQWLVSFTFFQIFGTTWLCMYRITALIIFASVSTDVESLNHLLWDNIFSRKWFEFKFHLAYSPLIQTQLSIKELFLSLHTRTNSHNQPSLQFENNEVVVGLGDELNAELKTTVQICDDRSVLGKILANICIF